MEVTSKGRSRRFARATTIALASALVTAGSAGIAVASTGPAAPGAAPPPGLAEFADSLTHPAVGSLNTGFAGLGSVGLTFDSGSAGSSNNGPDNTGSSNTGSYNTGSDNVGSANTGSGNVGFANTGSGNVGFGNTGSGNVGSLNTGSLNTGSGNTGILTEGILVTGLGSVGFGSLGINWN
ncbi:pentapeptide repeat-containing protein [Rhodococcus sp. NPDC055112]